VKAGKMKVLAVFGERRFKGLPNVPTVKEVLPDFRYIEGGIFVMGPAGMAPPVVQRLYSALARAARDPGVQPKLEGRGQIVALTPPQQFAKQVAETDALAAELIKAAGVKPE